MKFLTKKRKEKERAFSMIEMLIAVFVFSLSLAALMKMSSKSLLSVQNSREQLIGNYLAIEALELIHNLRDQAILNRGIGELDWHRVFQGGEDIFDDEGCFDGSGWCNFYIEDTGNPILGNCDKCSVFFDKENFYYFQTYHDSSPGVGKKSPFIRKIRIRSSKDSKDEVLVLVEVLWKGGGISYVDNLYLYQ